MDSNFVFREASRFFRGWPANQGINKKTEQKGHDRFKDNVIVRVINTSPLAA